MAMTMTQIEFITMLYGAVVSILIGSLAFLGITSWFALGEGTYIAVAATYNLLLVCRAISTGISRDILYVIPILIGALAFTRLTRYRWAARYPIAIISGVGAGVVFGQSVRAFIISPITDSVTNVMKGTVGAYTDPISPWVTFIPLIITPLAFTYSIRYAGWLQKGVFRSIYTLGRVFFMIMVGGWMGELAGANISIYPADWAAAYIKRPITAIQDVLAGRLTLV